MGPRLVSWSGAIAVGVISVLFARLADVVQTGFHVLLGTGVGSTLGLVFGGSAGIAALLGMAGYFAGVVQAPMPAFAIILRMIGNHDNVIAPMCASVLGYGTARVISRESLYHALSRLFIADAIRRRRAETVMTNPVA